VDLDGGAGRKRGKNTCKPIGRWVVKPACGSATEGGEETCESCSPRNSIVGDPKKSGFWDS